MFTDWNHTHGNSAQSQGDACTLSQNYWLEEMNQIWKKGGKTSSNQTCHLFSLSELMCIFHGEMGVKRWTVSVPVNLNRLQRERVRVGGETGKVWINGARSMINRPLTPIHFLLTLRALVTQMKMGGQGRSVMMIYVSGADVLFWRGTVWQRCLNVTAWTQRAREYFPILTGSGLQMMKTA